MSGGQAQLWEEMESFILWLNQSNKGTPQPWVDPHASR